MRYNLEWIKKDLARKMVFLGGPRKVGKTTMSLGMIKDKSFYMNWDYSYDRGLIYLKKILPKVRALVIAPDQELHTKDSNGIERQNLIEFLRELV